MTRDLLDDLLLAIWGVLLLLATAASALLGPPEQAA